MKKLHKLLYSLFGFFACNFGATGADAAGVKCGEIRDGFPTSLFAADGFQWHLYKDSKPTEIDTKLGICANNQCITVSSDKFNAVCVTYADVALLSLYESEASSYGCTEGYAYYTSGCIADEQCTPGYAACQQSKYHTKSCTTGCAQGYYYDSASRTCKLCPSYNTYIAGTIAELYGSTTSCNTTTYATVTKCYITNVTNGYDKATGDSYMISSDDMCMYQS